MKVIVAGGRDLASDPSRSAYLALVIGKLVLLDARLVLSGGCRGGDEIGKGAAVILGIPVRKYDADWNEHGKAAGPIRNEEMAKEADFCILMPGGKGTESMRKMCRKHGVKCWSVTARAVLEDNFVPEELLNGHLVIS